MQRRTLVLTLAAAGFIAGCGREPEKKAAAPAKTYRVGMDATYAPFGFQESEGKEYVGYDVDIIRAIGEVEGFKVEVHNLAFDGLIPALKTGSLDIVINDVTITEERKKEVSFSAPYYTAGLGLVVPKASPIAKQADLKGKRVGVSIGSTGAIVAHKMTGIEVREFNAIVDAFLDLKNGGIDAVINDKPTNEYFIEKKGRDYAKAVDGDFEVEYLGIAVAKNNPELLAAIDEGLKKIKANGRYSAIYKKWFGREPSAEELR